LVEGAFTTLPTFALIFAFLDFGMMLFRWSTLQNAVREGARYAITFQQQTDGSGTVLGQNASVANVVQQYSMGLVRTTDSPQHIFVKYYSQTDPFTEIPAGGNLPGNIVEVSIQNVTFGWMAPLSGSYGAGIPFYRDTSPLTLSVYSTDILGGLPAGVAAVPE
jgi:Flp pilus assembly protein TadG